MSDGIAIKHIKAYVQENGIIRIDNVLAGERNLIGRLSDDVKYTDLPEYEMDFSEAVKMVTKTISKDEDLMQGYKANIAMAFIDEVRDHMQFEEDYEQLHMLANKAADRFLKNWCKL